jgi:hypothetical protein
MCSCPLFVVTLKKSALLMINDSSFVISADGTLKLFGVPPCDAAHLTVCQRYPHACVTLPTVVVGRNARQVHLAHLLLRL